MEMIIDRISRLLKEKNKMAVDLCNALDIQQSTMSTWKARKRNPPAEYMPTIANFLAFPSTIFSPGKRRRQKRPPLLKRITFWIFTVISRNVSSGALSESSRRPIDGRMNLTNI